MLMFWDSSPYHLYYGVMPSEADGAVAVAVADYTVPTARRGSHFAEQTLAIIHAVNELGFSNAVTFTFTHSLGTSQFTLAANGGHNCWVENPLDWEPVSR